MDKSLPLVPNVSDALKYCLNPTSLDLNKRVCTNWPSNPSWNAMSISERICITTSSWVEEPPCSTVLQKECKRKSKPWLLIPWPLRSLLLLQENTPSGSVAVSCHHCPPSRKCGSLKPNTTRLVHPLCIENALKIFYRSFFWLGSFLFLPKKVGNAFESCVYVCCAVLKIIVQICLTFCMRSWVWATFF